ncbi:hypothetical protein G6F63_016363 [Rhizopus arrhizus]|nr:hypothetical protein G6F63_016363 [Rhizopus arrhizus]
MRIVAGTVRQLERQHRAEAILLACGDGMARVIGQARVVHRANRRMLVQQGNDRGGRAGSGTHRTASRSGPAHCPTTPAARAVPDRARPLRHRPRRWGR